jgi:hypothetical protein
MRWSVLIPVVMFMALPTARAQDPKFDYAKPEEVKTSEWKASAQLGLLFATGNSRSLTFSGGAAASYKAAQNKLAVEVAGALVRNEIRVAADRDGVAQRLVHDHQRHAIGIHVAEARLDAAADREAPAAAQHGRDHGAVRRPVVPRADQRPACSAVM